MMGKYQTNKTDNGVPRAIHNPGQFAFCHSALRMRQDRGLCEKALFRYNTEGHFKTCSYQCAAYTNNKEVLQHHRKKPINHPIQANIL